MTEQEWLDCADPLAALTFLRDRSSGRKLRLFAVACASLVTRGPCDPRTLQAIEAASDFADGRITAAELAAARASALAVGVEALEIIDAQGRRLVILDRERFLIGREAACDIRLPHPTVSRWHAQLQCNEQGGWLLQDLHSLNHVYFNEQPIEQIILGHGMQVRISEYWLSLRRLPVTHYSAWVGWAVTLEDDWACAVNTLTHGGDVRRPNGGSCALLRCVFGNPFRPAAALGPEVLAWNGGTVARLARAIYQERCFADLPVLADALEDAGCNDQGALSHLRDPGLHARGCHILDPILGFL
jgi:hypothetical protein